MEVTLFCYTVWQDLYTEIEKDIQNIQFHKGLPSCELLQNLANEHPGHKVIFLDDLQASIVNSIDIVNLATVYSHHLNYSVFILQQNIYAQGTYAKTIALQAHYIWCLKNLRDQTQLCTLSRQIFPRKCKLLPALITHIMKEDKYGYLLVDLYPFSDEKFRLRTHVFPGEDTQVFISS